MTSKANKNRLPIVLASGSAYRAALLRKLHLDFEICSSNFDETAFQGESPQALVRRLSFGKAHAISALYPNHLLIGSDQVAVCGERVLNKPGGRIEAIQQLEAQSGRSVRFYTGLCVLNTATGQSFEEVDMCTVHFRTLSDTQIACYVDLEQPFDCAGSFKSEGLGIALFSGIDCQDPNTLIGLPLIRLIDLLAKFGVGVL
ncbi:MAG: Maf family protein [Methylococcales bacterium]|nr:Maf family protein [Methylococcales bacterium]